MTSHCGLKRKICDLVFLSVLLSLFGCSLSCDTNETVSNVLKPATGMYSTLGNILPCINIDGKIFYWRGLATYVDQGNISDQIESEKSHIMTVLPVGFEYAGELEQVNLKEPTKNMEMAADFEANGIAYVNPACPEVVYAKITSDNIDGLYVRFSTDLMGDSDRIAYGGRLYQFYGHYVSELPKSFHMAGELVPIGCDNLPQQDFETNYPFKLGNVYVSDEDITCIYIDRKSPEWKNVHEFYVCPLWENIHEYYE